MLSFVVRELSVFLILPLVRKAGNGRISKKQLDDNDSCNSLYLSLCSANMTVYLLFHKSQRKK